MQAIPQLVLDLVYGTAIGGALGLTGTGGSILAVPTLVYLVGQDVHTAIGTSLAVVGGIAAEGMIQQRNSVQWNAGVLLGLCGIAGSIPGSLLSPYVSRHTAECSLPNFSTFVADLPVHVIRRIIALVIGHYSAFLI